MKRKGWLAGLALVAAMGIVVAPVLAGEKDKAPNPLKELKKATRNLAKVKGYRATCKVDGGLSRTADHKLFQSTVREEYTGDIRGSIMHVPGMKAYRTSSKGAIYDGVQWYALQALPDGKMLDRLFAFPMKLLQDAISDPVEIEWLESPDDEVVEEVTEGEGHTAVAKKSTTLRRPHRMRVRVPDKEAIQYFVEVQNSGCLSGG